VFSFGYPAGEHPDGDKPFTGRTMKWCYGKTAPMPAAPKYNLQEHIGFTCAFTAGASGGPFLYSYRTRTGYLIGVNSVAWDTDGNDRYDHVSSPYFDTDTYKVYKQGLQGRREPVDRQHAVTTRHQGLGRPRPGPSHTPTVIKKGTREKPGRHRSRVMYYACDVRKRPSHGIGAAIRMAPLTHSL
jgi:hypothetical protein